MQPSESGARSLLGREQGGEWCVTPVTGSAYRKAWDWPGAISVCRWGRVRKEVGRFASLWLYISKHQRKRKRKSERRGSVKNTSNDTEKRTVGRLVAVADWRRRAPLMQAFNPIWFTYCSVRHSCTWHKVFSTDTSSATLTRGGRERERERRCRVEAALFTQPCTGSEIGHYIDLNRFLVCMNSPVRRRRRRKKKKKDCVSSPWVHIDIHSGSPHREHKCHWKRPWYMLSFSPLPVAPSLFLSVSLPPSLFPFAGRSVPAAAGKEEGGKKADWMMERAGDITLLLI